MTCYLPNSDETLSGSIHQSISLTFDQFFKIILSFKIIHLRYFFCDMPHILVTKVLFLFLTDKTFNQHFCVVTHFLRITLLKDRFYAAGI